MLSRFSFLALCALVVVGASRPAHAAQLPPGLSLPDFARHLHLTPSSQFDGPSLDLIPAGPLADEQWEAPIVAGQFFTSAAINVAAAIVFSELSEQSPGTPIDTVRKKIVLWGLLQLALTPLVSASGVFFIGNASDLYEVGFGWPLLANYAAELILVAMKVGLGYGLGDIPGGEGVQSMEDIFGAFIVIDWVLHGILVPVAVTYFSIRSRGPKGLGFARADAPPSAAVVADVRRQGAFESAADRQATAARGPAASAGVDATLLAFSF